MRKRIMGTWKEDDNPHHPDPSTKKSIVTKEEIKNRNQHGG